MVNGCLPRATVRERARNTRLIGNSIAIADGSEGGSMFLSSSALLLTERSEAEENKGALDFCSECRLQKLCSEALEQDNR